MKKNNKCIYCGKKTDGKFCNRTCKAEHILEKMDADADAKERYGVKDLWRDPIAVNINYPKAYEDVFSSPRLTRCCDPRKVKVRNNVIPKEEYERRIKELYSDFTSRLWDTCVKHCWLHFNYEYMGHSPKGMSRNGGFLDRSEAMYLRNTLNVDTRIYNACDDLRMFGMMCDYVNALHPNLKDEPDPWVNPIPYPFKHIGVSHLYFTKMLPERMQLIQYGEDKGMPYLKFMDFCINYAMNYNDKVAGYQYYRLHFLKNFYHSIPQLNINIPQIIKHDDVGGFKRADNFGKRSALKYLGGDNILGTAPRLFEYIRGTKPKK
jgi:hypothetical protein